MLSQHNVCFNVMDGNAHMCGLQSGFVFSAGDSILHYVSESGSLQKTWRFDHSISYVACDPLSVLAVGCTDGSLWSCQAISESNKRQKVSKYAPMMVHDCTTDFECALKANGDAVIFCGASGPNSVDVLFVSAKRPREIRACLQNESHVVASLPCAVTCATRLDDSFCVISRFRNCVLGGTSDGAIYITRMGEEPETLVGPCGSKVLNIFAVCCEFLEGSDKALVNAVVAVLQNGTVLVFQECSETARAYSLGFEVGAASCEKNVLLVCGEDRSGAFRFRKGFPDRLDERAVSVDCAVHACVCQDSVWIVSKSGALCSAKLNTLDKWPVSMRNDNVKQAVQSIAVLSERQAVQKQKDRLLMAHLLDLEEAVRLLQHKDKIDVKAEAQFRDSGAFSIGVSIQNDSGVRIGKHWCVVIGCLDSHFSFPVLKEVSSPGKLCLEVVPGELKSYSPFNVTVSLTQLKPMQDSGGLGLKFSPCTAISILLKSVSFNLLSLCSVSNPFRSVVTPSPSVCLLHKMESSSSVSRTFRFIGHAEHVRELQPRLLESVYGHSVEIAARAMSNASFLEITVSCTGEESEATAVRAAVLNDIVLHMPSVLRVKVADWKLLTADLTALQKRVEDCSSIEELIAVYRDLRKIPLKF